MSTTLKLWVHHFLTAFMVFAGLTEVLKPLVSPQTFGMIISVTGTLKLLLHALYPDEVPLMTPPNDPPVTPPAPQAQ